MVYVPDRQRALVAGGFGTRGFRSDVWAYQGGTQWTPLPNETPTLVIDHALAYDPRRKRVVLFGGNDLDRTVELDTSDQWHVVTGPWDGEALKRSRAGLAWDAHIGKLVAFGGERAGATLGDTWEYDGTTWIPTATSGPAPTSVPALAWDYDDRELVLFDAAGATWIYRDHAWTPLIPADSLAPKPRGRSHGALTYDWQRHRLVLVGGNASDGTRFSDVWELDVSAATWQVVYVPPGGPLPRERFGFVGVQDTRTLLLYGGRTAGGHLADSWHLQFRSATPEEICNDGKDADDDLQPDDRDPDCGAGELCADSIDNDFDGLTDAADPECQL